jgi:hypothetical protein
MGQPEAESWEMELEEKVEDVVEDAVSFSDVKWVARTLAVVG